MVPNNRGGAEVTKSSASHGIPIISASGWDRALRAFTAKRCSHSVMSAPASSLDSCEQGRDRGLSCRLTAMTAGSVEPNDNGCSHKGVKISLRSLQLQRIARLPNLVQKSSICWCLFRAPIWFPFPGPSLPDPAPTQAPTPQVRGLVPKTRTKSVPEMRTDLVPRTGTKMKRWNDFFYKH